MTNLSIIIKHIVNSFNIDIIGEVSDNRSIATIRFLNETDMNATYLTPDILFLGDYNHFGECIFSGNVILVNAGDNPAKGDSLIIKESVDLGILLNLASECIHQGSLLQIKKDDLFSYLKNGRSLGALLKKAFDYIENPITLCDSSYSIIDSYPMVDDPRTLEKRNNRLSIKDVFSKDMKDSNLTNRIFHSVYPFITKVDDFDYDWVFESIRINHSVVGYICIKGINKAFTDDDLEIIHQLTQIISIHLQKDSDYINPQGIKYDRFLKELILKHFDNEKSITDQLSLFSVKPSSYYYLLAYDYINQARHALPANYTCLQLQSIFPTAITGTYDGLFLTLLPVKQTTPYSDATEERLMTFLQMNNMVGALSFVFTNLSEASTYFEQCCSVLSMLDPKKDLGKILRYGDYCFRHITNLLDDPDLLMATIHPALKFMKTYDNENSTDYLTTLKTYINENRSAPAAAEALHIHKSTFFYRLEKMKSLFNIDTSSADNMFAYEISFKLLDIAELNKTI